MENKLKMMAMLDEGLLDSTTIAQGFIGWLSDDDIVEFCHQNDIQLDTDEDEDEDEDEEFDDEGMVYNFGLLELTTGDFIAANSATQAINMWQDIERPDDQNWGLLIDGVVVAQDGEVRGFSE